MKKTLGETEGLEVHFFQLYPGGYPTAREQLEMLAFVWLDSQRNAPLLVNVRLLST